MSLLAETNRGAAGRWVLMPRRGERFMGPRERNRARARRRRRHVFVALLDATVLTLVMGLFPPFRVMLFATGALVVLLLAYTSVLVQIKASGSLAAGRGGGRPHISVAAMSRAAVADAYGSNGSGYEEDGHRPARHGRVTDAIEPVGYGHTNGHRNGERLSTPRARPKLEPPSGSRNGWHPTQPGDPEELLQLIDDDVHVIVRRAEDQEAEELASAAR